MEDLLSTTPVSLVSRTPSWDTALKSVCGEPKRPTESQVPGLGDALQGSPVGGPPDLTTQGRGPSRAQGPSGAQAVRTGLGLSCQSYRILLQLVEKELDGEAQHTPTSTSTC